MLAARIMAGQGARGVEPTTLWLKRFILSDNSVSCGGGAV